MYRSICLFAQIRLPVFMYTCTPVHLYISIPVDQLTVNPYTHLPWRESKIRNCSLLLMFLFDQCLYSYYDRRCSNKWESRSIPVYQYNSIPVHQYTGICTQLYTCWRCYTSIPVDQCTCIPVYLYPNLLVYLYTSIQYTGICTVYIVHNYIPADAGAPAERLVSRWVSRNAPNILTLDRQGSSS